MNKEEILKLAQNEKKNHLDEREQIILQKSSHFGMLVGLILCLILMVVKMWYDQPYQDVYAVYCSIMCGQYLYQWFERRERRLLIFGILWGIPSLALFFAYLAKIL